MKFRVRKEDALYRALHWWHPWFAWYPVRVPTSGRMSGMTLVWLETVERKCRYRSCMGDSWWACKYRWLKEEKK